MTWICCALLYQVIEAANRFQEGIFKKRNSDVGLNKKHRRSTIMQSISRPKRELMYKDTSVLEGSQKKKNAFPELPPLEFQESYHDSSVDKVQ